MSNLLTDRIGKAFDKSAFLNIFGDRFSYVLNRATSSNSKGFFFWKDGQKTEHKGLTDIGPSAYIRFENENVSGNYSPDDYGFVMDFKFVASLPNCKNAAEIARFVATLLLDAGFEVGNLSLNESAIWAEEMGEISPLQSNKVDFFSIGFTGIEYTTTQCDTDIFIENC